MSVTITDNFTPQTWGESYPATWGSEPYETWKYGLHDYGLLATNAFDVTDTLQNNVSRNVLEAVSVTDLFSRTAVWEKDLYETISVMETYWDVIQFRLSVSESFTITDDETNKMVKGVLVTLHIADKTPKKIMTKLLPITIFVEDSIRHKAKFRRILTEAVHIAEVAGKHYKGYYQEAFGIVDFFCKMFTENVSETITLGELLTHAFVARRLFAETVAFDELCSKHTELNKEELNNEELNNEELEKVNGSGLVTGFGKNYLHPDINRRKNKTENE